MDLVSNPDKTKVIVTMGHCAKDGSPKILQECTLPFTGSHAASQIFTGLAVSDVDRYHDELHLTEYGLYVSVDEIRAETGCDFITLKNLKQIGGLSW